MLRWGTLLVAVIGGCGSTQLVLKGPLSDRCEDTGLKGCAEITEGVLDYVSGDDQPAAMAKIKKGAAKNAPEDLRQFATSLRKIISAVPGGDSFAKPINDICELLDTASTSTPGAVAVTAGVASDQQNPVKGPAPASAPGAGGAASSTSVEDPRMLRSGTVTPTGIPRAVPCEVLSTVVPEALGPTLCARAAIGPILVTDVQASGGCPWEMTVTAGSPPRWFFLVPANGTLSVHDARMLVNVDEPFTVGVRARPDAGPLSPDLHCAVTWAGRKLESSDLGF